MRFQKSCDPRVGQSPATRPDMFVGKKTKSFYCFFPHVNSDWIAKESGTAAARGGGAAGTLRPRRGISHGLSQPPHTAPQFAAAPRRATLHSPLVVSSVNG